MNMPTPEHLIARRTVPLFPAGGNLTPQSTCPHTDTDLPPYPFTCMVCNRSHADGVPALRLDPANDPRPEPGRRRKAQ